MHNPKSAPPTTRQMIRLILGTATDIADARRALGEIAHGLAPDYTAEQRVAARSELLKLQDMSSGTFTGYREQARREAGIRLLVGWGRSRPEHNKGRRSWLRRRPPEAPVPESVPGVPQFVINVPEIPRQEIKRTIEEILAEYDRKVPTEAPDTSGIPEILAEVQALMRHLRADGGHPADKTFPALGKRLASLAAAYSRSVDANRGGEHTDVWDRAVLVRIAKHYANAENHNTRSTLRTIDGTLHAELEALANRIDQNRTN